MAHLNIISYVYFITVVAFVSGTWWTPGHVPLQHKLIFSYTTYAFNYEGQTNVQRTYPNLMPEFNRNTQQLPPSRNTKRMTIDENARSREGWGQMNSQYYSNPYQTSYYPNMRQNAGGNNNPYFSSTTPKSGAIIDIFKGMNKPAVDAPPQGKLQAEITVSKMHPLEKKVKVLICKLQGQT